MTPTYILVLIYVSALPCLLFGFRSAPVVCRSRLLCPAVGPLSAAAASSQIVPKAVVNLNIAERIEFERIMGTIDWKVDNIKLSTELTSSGDADSYVADTDRRSSKSSVRLFEGVFKTETGERKRCFMKEFLSASPAQSLGPNEIEVIRKLTSNWNKIQRLRVEDKDGEGQKFQAPIYTFPRPPFPVLLGWGISNEQVLKNPFRSQFRRKVPRARNPEPGTLWLVYEWDDASFLSMRTFTRVPQTVEIFDTFNKEAQRKKRWAIMRRTMRNALETLDYMHSQGFITGNINVQSLWCAATDFRQLKQQSVQVVDLGSWFKVDDAGPLVKKFQVENYYQLGFAFMEFVVATFCEDYQGARSVRKKLDGKGVNLNLFVPSDDIIYLQLHQPEFQRVFETLCDSDLIKFREFVLSIDGWKEAVELLEQDNGAAWKLILKLLANGSLREDNGAMPSRISGRKMIRESFEDLFKDTF